MGWVNSSLLPPLFLPLLWIIPVTVETLWGGVCPGVGTGHVWILWGPSHERYGSGSNPFSPLQLPQPPSAISALAAFSCLVGTFLARGLGKGRRSIVIVGRVLLLSDP